MRGQLTYSVAASDTGIRRRFRSSCRRWFNSVSRRNLSSAIDCFLERPLSLVRISYGTDILVVTLLATLLLLTASSVRRVRSRSGVWSRVM